LVGCHAHCRPSGGSNSGALRTRRSAQDAGGTTHHWRLLASARSEAAQLYANAAARAADAFANQLGSVYASDVTTAIADRLSAETNASVSAAGGGDPHQASSEVDRARSDVEGLLSGGIPLLALGLVGQQPRASDQPLLSAAT